MILQAPPKLTPREREILPFLLSGATRKEIAVTLAVSPETIKIHVKNLLEKFEAATLRDGFKAMNLYQHYYGISGIGADRFINSADLSVELVDKFRKILVTTSIDLTVMSGKIEKLCFSQMTLNHIELVSYTGGTIGGPFIRNSRTFYDLVPDVPLVEGDRFNYSFCFSVAATSIVHLSEYIEETTFPATRRSYELIMPDEIDVLDYGYDVF